MDFLGHMDLQLLPRELFYRILDNLDVQTFCCFAEVSKTFQEHCREYLDSSFGARYIQKIWFPNGQTENLKGLGKLLRILTVFETPKLKIEYAVYILSKAGCMWDLAAITSEDDFANFSFTLSELTKGIKDHNAVCTAIDRSSGMNILIQKVLYSVPGTYAKEEKIVRSYYSRIFIKHIGCHRQHIAFLQMLQAFPFYIQAKILLLIYAPLINDGPICWDVFAKYNDGDLYRTATALRSLANTMDIMLYLTTHTQEDVVMIVCELTGMPNHWHEVYTCLLVFYLGNDVVFAVVRNFVSYYFYEDFSAFVISYAGLKCCFEGKMPVRRFAASVSDILGTLPEDRQVQCIDKFTDFVSRRVSRGDFFAQHDVYVIQILIKSFQRLLNKATKKLSKKQGKKQKKN